MNCSPDEPLVSVVITSYNYAQYLPVAVESVLRQSYNQYEVIIVNDGSTDNTDDVVGPYLSNPKIRYVKQHNLGQASAKNTGIRNSAGDFIAFLDADDIWRETKLETQMKLFNHTMVGVVYSRMRFISQVGEPVDQGVPNRYLTPRAGQVTESLFIDNFVPFSSAIVRKGCLDKVGGFDETLRMGIDWDLWLRMSVDYEFAYVDEPLMDYRVGHLGQMSRDLGIRQKSCDQIMARFIEEHGDLLSKGIIREAWAHTYCNRGDYSLSKGMPGALSYYVKALWHRPVSERAYKGIVKSALRRMGVRPWWEG